MSVTIKIPGKLYIAGEYAILNPGNPAILIGINAYLTCRVSPHADNTIHVYSDTIQNPSPLIYPFNTLHEVYLTDRQWAYVQAGLKVSLQYLRAHHHIIQPCKMSLTSDLNQKNGQKYGLGSSGAVTLAVIKGILSFHNIRLDTLVLFKLATIASLSVSSNGSFGDLAASAFGGWVYYESLDRNWLKTQLEQDFSLPKILHMEWPKLLIKPLRVDPQFHVHIGWTQVSASTDLLVSQFESPPTNEGQAQFDAKTLNHASKENVKQIASALESGDFPSLSLAFQEARTLLSHWAHLKKIQIETHHLSQLIQLAQNHGLIAKSSGAGGGDCGIAISYCIPKTVIQSLYHDWKESNILPLPFYPIKNQ